MKSKIFVTAEAVDYAYVSRSGHIIGNSERPLLSIEGNIDTAEDVVVDFGTIKRELKAFKFFDHMLVINNDVEKAKSLDVGYYDKIITTNYELDLPKDGVYDAGNLPLVKNNISRKRLFKHALDNSPLIKTLCDRYNVIIDLVGFTLPTTLNFFEESNNSVLPIQLSVSYCHILPKSTSRGCQTLHGHGSKIYYNIPATKDCGIQLPDYNYFMDNTISGIVVIGRKYTKTVNNVDSTTYIVESKDRVHPHITVKHILDPKNPFLQLDNPPTQETLCNYLADDCNMDLVYLTEGIGKGVMPV